MAGRRGSFKTSLRRLIAAAAAVAVVMAAPSPADAVTIVSPSQGSVNPDGAKWWKSSRWFFYDKKGPGAKAGDVAAVANKKSFEQHATKAEEVMSSSEKQKPSTQEKQLDAKSKMSKEGMEQRREERRKQREQKKEEREAKREQKKEEREQKKEEREAKQEAKREQKKEDREAKREERNMKREAKKSGLAGKWENKMEDLKNNMPEKRGSKGEANTPSEGTEMKGPSPPESEGTEEVHESAEGEASHPPMPESEGAESGEAEVNTPHPPSEVAESSPPPMHESGEPEVVNPHPYEVPEEEQAPPEMADPPSSKAEVNSHASVPTDELDPAGAPNVVVTKPSEGQVSDGDDSGETTSLETQLTAFTPGNAEAPEAVVQASSDDEVNPPSNGAELASTVEEPKISNAEAPVPNAEHSVSTSELAHRVASHPQRRG